MFYLLEWVKLLYFLNTFYFPAPSRSHLQLCFCGDVAYFIKKKKKKKSSFRFVAYTWASGVLVCLNIIHAIQGLPLTFRTGQSKLNMPFPATWMLMQGYHLDMGEGDHDDLKVCFNYSRMFCISIKYTPV